MKFVDQLQQEIEIRSTPERIISLVPSQTELLYDLGLQESVVGITKFCVHPTEWRKTKTIIGGTKNFDIEAIKSLRPDLILANKEENDLDRIRALQHHFPVWASDVSTKQLALEMIAGIGVVTQTTAKAYQLIYEINQSFQSLQTRSSLRVLYLIWRNPWMAAGADTFIHAMIQEIGWKNCIQKMRYPEITGEQMIELNPELILLSSEPFPFQQKHVAELSQLLPHTKIQLVDGEMFSWYGSRMRYAPGYFNSIQYRIDSVNGI